MVLKNIVIALAVSTASIAGAKPSSTVEFDCALGPISAAGPSKLIQDSVKSCVEAGDYAAAAKLYILGGTYAEIDMAFVPENNLSLRSIAAEVAYWRRFTDQQRDALEDAIVAITLAPETENACVWVKQVGAPTYSNIPASRMNPAWQVAVKNSPACDPKKIEMIRKWKQK